MPGRIYEALEPSLEDDRSHRDFGPRSTLCIAHASSLPWMWGRESVDGKPWTHGTPIEGRLFDATSRIRRQGTAVVFAGLHGHAGQVSLSSIAAAGRLPLFGPRTAACSTPREQNYLPPQASAR